MRDAVVFPYWDAVFDATVERGHPPETLYDHLADDETARRTVQAGFRATAAVTAPGVLDAVLGQFAGDVPSAPNPLGGSVPLSTVAAIGTAFADLTHLVRSTHGHTRSVQSSGGSGRRGSYRSSGRRFGGARGRRCWSARTVG
jgi:uncharacterized membrane protein YgcG